MPKPRTVKLRVDARRVLAEIREYSKRLSALERFAKFSRDVVHDLLRRRGQDLVACSGPAAVRAGHLVLRAEIRSRDFKLVLAALRAIDRNVAHRKLRGRKAS